MRKSRMFKGIVSILLVVLLVTLSACATKVEPNVKESGKTEQTPKKEKEKEDPYATLKIGVVNIGASTDVAGYTYAHIDGLKRTLQNLGIKEDQVIYKDNVPDGEADYETIKQKIQELVDAGCKIIFTTSFGFAQATKDMAEKYPDIVFSHCSGELSNGKNFNRYFGRIYQPFYLAGIAAGMKTKSNKIGFVSAWGRVVSESAYCLNAFAMGVESVNPNAKVFSYAINSWGDEQLEKTAANALVAKGVDVIAQDTDSKEPQVIAQANKIFGIGYNSDMSKETPDATLLSVIWNWSSYYTYAIQSVVEENWKCENYFGGFEEGTVAITDIATFNEAGADAKIQEAKAKFSNGSWDVFTGVLTTNEGTTVGAANTSLDDDTIQFRTNWLYKNIVELK